MAFEHISVLQPGIAMKQYPSIASKLTPYTKYVIIQRVRPGTFDQLFFERVAHGLKDDSSSPSFQYVTGLSNGEETRFYVCLIQSSLKQMDYTPNR